MRRKQHEEANGRNAKELSIEMFDEVHHLNIEKRYNDGLQLRRAISIQPEGKSLLEKHAIAPSAARLCSAAGVTTSFTI